MGVKGLTSLLQQMGWMPKPQEDCSFQLWNSPSIIEINQRIELIPPGSILAVDGNGLAHHLHSVAYSRYFKEVTGRPNNSSSSSSSSSGGCVCKKKLTPSQVTLCLPQSMPLRVLDEVTKEFVGNLERNQMKLVVYWDGEGRRMKAATTQKRINNRTTEWSHLHQYCLHGILPFAHPCQRNFLSNFPASRLIVQQVRITLREIPTVDMVMCDEEADREVAMASANHPHCYVLGLDSDYCLFPRCKYVPFNTLDASSPNHVTGCIIDRETLADAFQLPSEESLLELAILMGNDYIGDTKEAQLSFHTNQAEEAMQFLREQGEGYQVTTNKPETQGALDFTRALYEFRSLDEFPFDEEITDEAVNKPFETEEEVEEEDKDEMDDLIIERPLIPSNFNMEELAVANSSDTSLRDIVARPIQVYIDACAGKDRTSMISQPHLNTFSQLSLSLFFKINQRSLEPSRPKWEDVLACYMIEMTLVHIYRFSGSSLIVKRVSPTRAFDIMSFQCLMEENRNRLTAQGDENSKEEDDLNVDGALTTPASTESPPPTSPPKPVRLPIDEYEGEILNTVENQRVTIIHGETGCGKSSRVPIMLLRAPPPNDAVDGVRIFMSQPRRIAAKSLVERVRSCEPDLKNKFALRMGHGVREYELSTTRAWFVTTGYIVRLLANHPESFDRVSHLIIDEVHERSVDTDILCLLCRRLLKTNPSIRLILMSATIAADLYREYFDVQGPAIYVRGRRFPIQEYFVEDLARTLCLPPNDVKAAENLRNMCEKIRCKGPPGRMVMEQMFQLAMRVTIVVGEPGSSVLIFVPGMNEIISIMELIEKMSVPGKEFTCFPIHSDIPFEDQMAAFDVPAKNEVKVVIATNAAESSVTLPAVDHVICLGLCKQIIYNKANHRQMLASTWISKASATQRAGRTGRVREGNVYRLYTRQAMNEYMDKFEMGEILRVPLDSVILSLKEMLNEAATPVLMECLEAPDISAIDRSFKSLYQSNFISSPTDEADITHLGHFVSSLGVDLRLGSLVGLGIQFGVGPEVIEMAAVLSFPQSPWIMSSPFNRTAREFNDMTARTFASRCHFDANLYSEPMAEMNLMWDYERNAIGQKALFNSFGILAPRLRRLLTTRNSLRNRVAKFLGIDSDKLSCRRPPSQMPHGKVVMLRVLQVWVFYEGIISFGDVALGSRDKDYSITLRSSAVTEEQLQQVLDKKRHRFSLISNRTIQYVGKFLPMEIDAFEIEKFLPDFMHRLISFAVDKEYQVLWMRCGYVFVLVVRDEVAERASMASVKDRFLMDCVEDNLVATPTIKTRGIHERASGHWDVVNYFGDDSYPDKSVKLTRWTTYAPAEADKIAKYMKIKSLQIDGVKKSLECSIKETVETRKKKKMSVDGQLGFRIWTRGLCKNVEVTRTDAVDLFATSRLSLETQQGGKETQACFHKVKNRPIDKTRKTSTILSSDTSTTGDNSWNQPLLNDIPEGARLLSVLASSTRNKNQFIKFPVKTKMDTGAKEEEEEVIKVELSREGTNIAKRWKRYSTSGTVYVAENSVVSAALPYLNQSPLYAVASNILEIKGGAVKVDGLTMLPPGGLFMLLAFLTFGMQPFNYDGTDNVELLERSLEWLSELDDRIVSLGGKVEENPAVDVVERIELALKFRDDCQDMNEELTCRSKQIEQLVAIFDNVDGYHCTMWKIPNLSEYPNETVAMSTTISGPRPTPASMQQKKSGKREVQAEVEPDRPLLSGWDAGAHLQDGHTTMAKTVTLSARV